MNTKIEQAKAKLDLLEKAGHRCEGCVKYPNCRAKEGEAHPVTDSPVKLVVINDHVWCPRCALTYDYAEYRSADWRAEREAKKNGELFPIPDRPVNR